MRESSEIAVGHSSLLSMDMYSDISPFLEAERALNGHTEILDILNDRVITNVCPDPCVLVLAPAWCSSGPLFIRFPFVPRLYITFYIPTSTSQCLVMDIRLDKETTTHLEVISNQFQQYWEFKSREVRPRTRSFILTFLSLSLSFLLPRCRKINESCFSYYQPFTYFI